MIQSGAVFCAFDTETTGLNPDMERIIEIGAVKFNKDGILDTYSVLINPQKPLPQISIELCHITDEMLEGKPIFFEAADSFLRFINGTVLLAHNAQFDLRFVNAELARLNRPPLKQLAIDTLRFARTVFPKPQTTSWKLSSLAEKLNIEVKEAHRAQDDARVCMEVFLKCVEEYDRIKGRKKFIPSEPLQGQLDFHSGTP